MDSSKKIIIGIDYGASSTKIVAVDDELLKQHIILEKPGIFSPWKAVQLLKLKGSEIKYICCTGGRSSTLQSRKGLVVKNIDEISAISAGAVALSQIKKTVVVSAGTGTAILY